MQCLHKIYHKYVITSTNEICPLKWNLSDFSIKKCLLVFACNRFIIKSIDMIITVKITFFMTDTTTLTLKENVEERNAQPGVTFSTETIIGLSVGSVIVLVMILAISREIFLYCRLPRSSVILSDTYDVYANICDIGNKLK